ncbi:MAG: stalk-specific protein X [Caulobacter sp.]|nr:stalk-specific protein X [Caulobacter sp.]
MGETTAPKPAAAGLLGGPRTFTGMSPIPNPGDLTRAERVKYYGHRYDYLPEPKGKTGATSGSGAPRFQLITRRKADGTLQISMRPVANPEDMTAAERRRVYGNRYAPRAVVAAAPRRSWRVTPAAKPVAAPAKPAAKPVVAVAPRPAAKPAARPVIAAAPAPVIKPAAPAPAVAAAPPKPVVAPKPNPTQQLQAAVSADINRGASLSVPADLKAGKEADVVLSLPGDLLAMVQAQAAKLGLTKPAKKVSAYANLQGQGYEISPPGQQTAPVAAGKPTTFTWKVKPTEGEKSPLRADYGLELNGSKPTTAFSVGSLEEAVAAPVEAAKDAARGFKLPTFKLPSFKMPSLKALAFPWVPEPTLPVVGKLARETVVGGALALLALILVIAMARGASSNRARAERRRKFRTMQDYGVNEPDHAPDAHHTGYVNPMVAAAAGGAAGYSFASSGHDDHGHGHDDHGHDDHSDGHSPDDHGHGPADDHGHGHDDHGPAQHVSHDPHGQDDHGHGHDDHGHGDGHGHDDHGHGHDDHGPAQHVSHDAHGHDDHGPGHGHDDHGHGHDDHGHGQDDHGHGQDDHGHHGHDEHHKEPEHAH